MMPAIQVENLVKQYKNGARALDGMRLRVEIGEIFSLLGENGAGKSTLIHILTTCLEKTSGEVKVLGKALAQEAAAIRRQIACVRQHTSIDGHLSLEENMMFQARLYQVPADEAQARMRQFIQCFALRPYIKHPVFSYSGGVMRRLDIAMTMMSLPKILFLDEPTVGMDVQSRKAMWEMMKKIRSDFKTTIFLTTHYLEEAAQLADTVCMMKNGRALVQGAPQNLLGEKNALRIIFGKAEQAESCGARLKNELALNSVNVKDALIFVETADEQRTFYEVNEWLLTHHMPYRGIEIVCPTLEDIFLDMMEKSEKEAAL